MNEWMDGWFEKKGGVLVSATTVWQLKIFFLNKRRRKIKK